MLGVGIVLVGDDAAGRPRLPPPRLVVEGTAHAARALGHICLIGGLHGSLLPY